MFPAVQSEKSSSRFVLIHHSVGGIKDGKVYNGVGGCALAAHLTGIHMLHCSLILGCVYCDKC